MRKEVEFIFINHRIAMIEPLHHLKSSVFIALSVISTTLIGCTIGPDMKRVPIDAASVKQIFFEIDIEAAGYQADDTANHEMAETIASHLNEWGYTIGSDADKPAGHRMQATIEAVKHGSTPTGFSFTAGNSDPRAVNFQKAEIVPITCSLISTANSTESADYTMEFIAKPLSGGEKRSRLIDQVSTVCLNLLKSLKVQPEERADALQATSPSWAPDVLIETVEEPETQTEPGKPVPSETNDVNAEKKSYKQITIHNQGSPVILKLGHERK
ncbi:hypothetical protein [Methylotuvimicrobium alcaliphilum]|nr:hypothetical protein [Methylotuvimicrobium alcaliphilum]